MLLSRSKPAVGSGGGVGGSLTSSSSSSSGESKLPKLEDFLEKKDYLGALTLLEKSSGATGNNLSSLRSLIAYCCFHLGDFKRALEEYQAIISSSSNNKGDKDKDKDKPDKGGNKVDESLIHLNTACCLFYLGMYPEAQEEAVKGEKDTKDPSSSPLRNRLLFHLAHKLGNEDGVIHYHGKLEEVLENQLSLASMHYLRGDYQSSIDIYKRILLDNSLGLFDDDFLDYSSEDEDDFVNYHHHNDDPYFKKSMIPYNTNPSSSSYLPLPPPSSTSSTDLVMIPGSRNHTHSHHRSHHHNHNNSTFVDMIVSSYSPGEVTFVRKLLKIPRDYIALNVYVALCYHRLEYFDVSQEVLAVYLQAFPGSAIALNLRACNTFRLYNGPQAEKELKPLLNLMNQDNSSSTSPAAHDLIRHNLVVFRGGQGALQTLPKLVDVIPEARLNLIIYYLQKDDVKNASELIKGTKTKGTPEKILFAIVNLLLSYETGNREYLQSAQTAFNQVGSSETEHDSVFGRLCMASAHFLSRNFEHAALYMNSVRTHYFNDDTFNFNYAQAKGMLNQFQEVEELLTMIQNEKIRADFTYVQWLARAYIMNKKPRLAWELHERMETSAESFRLLQLIANECYRLGQFYYAAKAFDLLEKYEPSTEHWDGKRGAIIGVFQLIIAGQEPRESLHDIIALLRSSSKPQAEKILGIIKKWAKDNRINL